MILHTSLGFDVVLGYKHFRWSAGVVLRYALRWSAGVGILRVTLRSAGAREFGYK